ncbi:flagellar biosynthesis protein FlhF [Motiliproteus sediminis]|uniref:flagellar biosynthesis protein FlhF n=1 Tax=Motiliproteus sediminis TaxID=1468178 RepID=UPI001AEF4259
MKVRRFFAPDMSQAMRLVRDEVGPDAVILSNNRVAGGVEVVVALEYDAPKSRDSLSRPVSRRPETLKQAGEQERKQRQLSALMGGAASRPARLDAEMGRARGQLAERQARAQSGEVTLLQPKGKNRQISLDDDAWDEVLAHLQRRGQRDADKPAVSAAPPAAVAAATERDRELQAMRAEIDDLKGLLRAQLAQSQAPAAVAPAKPTISDVSPLQRRLLDRFARVGLRETLARRLVQGVEEGIDAARAWKIALARLADAVPAVGEDLVDRGGIVAFVGATGVGKTTTIGKLAARYVLKHGSSGIALVTTDSHRIAAHEQLRTFGRILDIPVRVVDENRPLDEALDSLRDKRLVLVDTAGMGGNDAQRAEQLAMLADSRHRIKKLLVLPSTAQYQVLRSAYGYVKELGLNGVVLSKMDEAVSLGEVLSTVVECRLPLAYLADGQKIPDNIDVARATALVSRAVVMAEKQTAVAEPVADGVIPRISDAV